MSVIEELNGLEHRVARRMKELRPLVNEYRELEQVAQRLGLSAAAPSADNERTRLTMVRTKPIPFPPEPFRYGGIQLTRWSIDHADRNGGNRNLWLRTLDKVGLGFES